MEYPYIDILVATFNGENFISEQLDSLLKQTYPNINIIISDDGSKDNTINIINQYIKKYPNKIRLLKNNNKHGINANFDYLLQHHLSNYVMFCDQDDIWFKNKVMDTYQEMHNMERQYGNNTAIIVFSDKIIIDDKLNVISNSHMLYEDLQTSELTINKLLIQNIISGCSMMINSSLIDICENIPEQSIMYDYWLALIASAFGQIYFINKPLMYYRQHSCNNVGAKKTRHIVNNILQFLMGNIPPFKKRFADNIEQAELFYNIYKTHLSKETDIIMRKMISLKTVSIWKRILITYKYNIIKKGIINYIKIIY